MERKDENSISVMNYDAVNLMLDEEYEKAKVLFHYAIQTVARLFEQKCCTTTNSDGSSSSTSAKDLVLRTMPLYIWECGSGSSSENDYEFDNSSSSTSCTTDAACPSSPLLYYDTALILVGTDRLMTSSRETFNRTTRVLLFNLALTHQIQGLRTDTEALHNLRIYQLALEACNIQRDTVQTNTAAATLFCSKSGGRRCSCWYSSADSLIMLAIWNNMATICSQFHLQQQSKNFIQNMESLLSAVQQQFVQPENNESTGIESESRFFYMNILVSKCVLCAPVA